MVSGSQNDLLFADPWAFPPPLLASPLDLAYLSSAMELAPFKYIDIYLS
jgi:hypothetical protein